ncbi:MAG: yicI 4, partial [Mucilaginibacter sp.]|nr:yicI 4 [Mucilaginibacter sp.]
MLKQKLILFLILLTGFWLKAENVNANIISYKKEADGVSFSLNKGLMKIKICRDDIIEVKYTILKSFSQSPSLVVNNHWASHVGFTVTESGGNVVINTGKLKVVVNKITQAITYTTISGKVITAEDKTDNKSM